MKIQISKKGWFKQSWSFKIAASNGKTLCVSEKYFNKQDMLDTIDLIKSHAYNCPVNYLNIPHE